MSLNSHRTLWDLTRGQRARYLAAIAAMWLAIVLLFGVPLVTKLTFDGVLSRPAGHTEALYRWIGDPADIAPGLLGAAVLIVVLTTLSGAGHYLRGRWAGIASEAIVRGLRERLYGHLDALPCTYHDKADTGDLVQRCSSDVETIRVFLAAQAVEIGRTVLILATALPLLLVVDVRMTLAATALMPVILTFAIVFFRKVKALFLRMDEAEGAMTSVLQENLTGIRVVRAFARQDFECEKFGEKNAAFRDKNFRLIRLLGVYWATSDFLAFSQMGLALLCGAWWLRSGDISIGTLSFFVLSLSIVIWPVRQLGRVLTDTGKAVVALGRLKEILGEAEETTPGRERLEAASLAGAIEFSGLGFSFGEKRVLHDVSFSLVRGESLAIVGPPGAGKSALIQVLLRLYDYDQGSVKLDGRELNRLERRFVRSQMGVVLQEPFLYSKTVGQNVRVGRSGATDEEMVESANAACIHGAIMEFERGYETVVGERGVTLSGGQRQRVALARALLKDPPILILDDALSAVDTRTEASILEALRRRRRRRTTLLIAHRVSTIRHMDRILVLEKGRVAQSGTHDELFRVDGPYRRLWRIQDKLESEIETDRALASAEEESS